MAASLSTLQAYLLSSMCNAAMAKEDYIEVVNYESRAIGDVL